MLDGCTVARKVSATPYVRSVVEDDGDIKGPQYVRAQVQVLVFRTQVSQQSLFHAFGEEETHATRGRHIIMHHVPVYPLCIKSD